MSNYDDEETPCLEVVRDTERFATYCNRVKGHQGPHFDTPLPMGMTAAEWDKFVRAYR